MAYPIDQESLSAPRQNVVLTVGRLGSYQKNSECLLEAIGRLAPGSGEFRFIGEHTDEFAAKVAHAQAALPQDILLYDRINERHELFAHYAQARVFVLTSRFESFGIVLVEAMAHGCYVVSTELSSARDIIGDDEDVGLIVPQNDPEAVARAISTALGRAIDHGSIAQKAKRYYYKNIIRNLAWIPGAGGATS
jgi:glycosyltransferase involved in cell wall biosynthesis